MFCCEHVVRVFVGTEVRNSRHDLPVYRKLLFLCGQSYLE